METTLQMLTELSCHYKIYIDNDGYKVHVTLTNVFGIEEKFTGWILTSLIDKLYQDKINNREKGTLYILDSF